MTGRRLGKTTGLIQALLLGNAAYPGALRRRGVYFWVSPDYTQASVAIRMLKQMLGGFARYREQTHTFTLRNGSAIVVKTAENEKGLRGEGLSGFVLDEAAFVKPKILTDCLLPSVKDKRGFGYLCTTPNGFNHVYDLWARVESNPDWLRFNAPSWLNPLLDRVELEAERDVIGAAAWNAEYGGEFTAAVGAIFEPTWFEDILVSELPPKYRKSLIAVDLALGKSVQSDYQAVCFMGLVADKFWCDVRLFRTSIDTLLAEVKVMAEQYQPTHGVVFEEDGFQQLAASAFRDKFPGLNCFTQSTGGIAKETRVQRLSGPLSHRELKILNTPTGRQAVFQLRDFPMTKFKDGPDAIEQAHRFMFSAA